MDHPSSPLFRALLAGLLFAFVGGVAASLAMEPRNAPAAGDAVLRRAVRDAPVAPPLDLAGPAAAVAPRPPQFPLELRITAPPPRHASVPPRLLSHPAILARAPPAA